MYIDEIQQTKEGVLLFRSIGLLMTHDDYTLYTPDMILELLETIGD